MNYEYNEHKVCTNPDLLSLYSNGSHTALVRYAQTHCGEWASASTINLGACGCSSPVMDCNTLYSSKRKAIMEELRRISAFEGFSSLTKKDEAELLKIRMLAESKLRDMKNKVNRVALRSAPFYTARVKA